MMWRRCWRVEGVSKQGLESEQLVMNRKQRAQNGVSVDFFPAPLLTLFFSVCVLAASQLETLATPPDPAGGIRVPRASGRGSPVSGWGCVSFDCGHGHIGTLQTQSSIDRALCLSKDYLHRLAAKVPQCMSC